MRLSLQHPVLCGRQPCGNAASCLPQPLVRHRSSVVSHRQTTAAVLQHRRGSINTRHMPCTAALNNDDLSRQYSPTQLQGASCGRYIICDACNAPTEVCFLPVELFSYVVLQHRTL